MEEGGITRVHAIPKLWSIHSCRLHFKMFLHGLPYLWADKKYWDIPPEDLPFDFIQPFVNEYNKNRTDMIHVLYLMLDESMSGWRPKTSKTGGLPHISHEPRKPVPLGTMIRNAVEVG